MNDDIHVLRDDRSLGSLISGLTQDVGSLVRKEVELARTEMSEKFSQAIAGLVLLALAALLMLGGFIVLLDAAVYGLAEVLPEDFSPWLAALIVGVLVLIAGYLMLRKGLTDLQAKNLMPTKTVASVKQDQELLKEHLT